MNKNLLAQVKKMQDEMAKAQEELAATVVTGTAAGGAITVNATCDQRVKSIVISKDAVDVDDLEMLEDLIVVAVNDALAKASETQQQRMAAVTGNIRIPGIM
ncbi:MAG TPA: YbaB/EbfC family nucleoid-associated protein [Candidatus Tumulicola sp.]|nr:YbaB/EbfC family nucleoid-associated protein [Candidatus Tumulicola sp.]